MQSVGSSPVLPRSDDSSRIVEQLFVSDSATTYFNFTGTDSEGVLPSSLIKEIICDK